MSGVPRYADAGERMVMGMLIQGHTNGERVKRIFDEFWSP